MWRRAKNHNITVENKTELSLSQKYFKSHFNTDHIKLNVLEETEHTPVYIPALQSLSSRVNNNETRVEE